MRRLLFGFLIFLALQINAFAIETQPYFEPLFVDGNHWTYQTNTGHEVQIEVLPGIVDFNGCPNAKRVKISTFDGSGQPVPEYFIRFYKQDSAGFYELGTEKYEDSGSGFELDYTLVYNPAKKIAALEMDFNVPLQTTGEYIVKGYTIDYVYTSELIGIEEVTIPYGTLDALKFTATQANTPPGNSSTSTYYSGAGISILIEIEDNGDSMELVSFENNAIPPSAIPGDSDGDGDVDGNDLLQGDIPTLAQFFGISDPTDEYDNAWYSYQSEFMGFSETRTTLTVNNNTFEEKIEAKNNGTWIDFVALKGACYVINDIAYLLTTQVFYRPDITLSGEWYSEGSPVFEGIRQGYWGSASIQVSLSMDGLDMITWHDKNHNDIQEPDEVTRHAPAPDDTQAIGGGTFPQVQYTGLGFHNTPNTVAIYISFDSFFAKMIDTNITSVNVDITGPTRSIINIPLIYYPDREEWGVSSFSLTPQAEGGLWWISRVETHLNDGSTSNFNSNSPYGTFLYSYTSSTGFSRAGLTSDEPAGQDYTPPIAGAYYYIETFPNGSSAGRVDPVIKVYAQGNTAEWIALNDDGGRSDLHAGLEIPLTSGDTYYIAVEDAYENGGAYSIMISSVGYTGSSTNTVAFPDTYEPDNLPAQATQLILDTPQDHSFSVGETDWYIIQIP
ncbi:MAG: hypothetical protein GY699_13175 [Desulfobacteraceae bacterium]|nr:hypothetical protein [Desulfobacteraceae bacterium]